MLSAVETFGPATAAATNAYAVATNHHHYNPFSIAAAVMPSNLSGLTVQQQQFQQQQQQIQSSSQQLQLEYNTLLGHSPLLNSHLHLPTAGSLTSHFLSAAAALHHPQLHHPSGIYLPPIPLSLSSNSLLPSPSASSTYSTSSISCPSPSSTSSIIPPVKSPRLSTDSGISLTSPDIPIMSSTEFVRPHPKQPRYSTANTNSNSNNNNIVNSNSSPNSSIIPANNNVRNNSKSSNINNNEGRSTNKYSIEPQTGPVNLATNNNNNNNTSNSTNNINKNNNNTSNNNNNNSNSSNDNDHDNSNHNNNNSNTSNNRSNSPTELEVNVNNNSALKAKNCNTINTSSADSQNDIMASLYSSKLQLGTSVPTSTQIAAAYQYNYPHLYPRGPSLYGSNLYPGHPSLSNSVRQSTHNGRPEANQFTPYPLGSSIAFSPSEIPSAPQQPSSLQQSSTSNILKSPLATANILNNSRHNSHSNNNTANSNDLSHQQLPPQTQKSPSSALPGMNSQENNNSLYHVPHSSTLPVNLSESQQQRLNNLKELHKNSLQLINNKNNNNLINNKQQSTSPNSIVSFKVPSGKEGSLKHRFLPRTPGSERNENKNRHSPNSTTIIRTSSNVPSNFTKGSCIELGNGVFRKVEDMRTEDFIQSAEKSPYHQLADSTVVKIVNTPNNVIITFSYDKNRSKADVEVSLEHPFFVYGQGWASCNPDLTLQTFGLRCQRLQVGDVCISLIHRDQNSRTPPQQQQHPHQQSNQLIHAQQHHKSSELSPQNLSRKSQLHQQQQQQQHHSYLSQSQSQQQHLHHQQQQLHLSNRLPSHHMPYDMQTYEETISRQQNGISSTLANYGNLPESRFLQPQLPLSLVTKSGAGGEFKFSPPPPPLSNNDRPYYLGMSGPTRSSIEEQASYVRHSSMQQIKQEVNNDLSTNSLASNGDQLSRKRRWSISDEQNLMADHSNDQCKSISKGTALSSVSKNFK